MRHSVTLLSYREVIWSFWLIISFVRFPPTLFLAISGQYVSRLPRQVVFPENSIKRRSRQFTFCAPTFSPITTRIAKSKCHFLIRAPRNRRVRGVFERPSHCSLSATKAQRLPGYAVASPWYSRFRIPRYSRHPRRRLFGIRRGFRATKERGLGGHAIRVARPDRA